MNLENLVQQNESDYLDFKQEWYKDTACLILDILCMANSDAKSDRYIVIGYNEEDKKFCNISENRLKQDNLCNLLSTANFNRIPTVKIETLNISNNEIDIIIIKKSSNRPYYLLKDKRINTKNKTIIAGVVYTRNGSVNTPVDQSTPESQIADMWRERFGLLLSPRERLEIYVKDYNNWGFNYNELELTCIWHYIPFPEFTIEYTLPNHMTDYNPDEHADAVFAHSIGNSYETSIRYKYHTTILKTESLYICDKGRYYILHPKTDWLYYNPDNYEDIHVFVNNASLSNKGKTIDEIDFNYSDGGCHRQVTFFYNIKNSFEYLVQKIINKNSQYDIYKDYFFFYDGCGNSEENKDITCPNKIYLLEQNENIAQRLRNEFLSLQKNKRKRLSGSNKKYK